MSLFVFYFPLLIHYYIKNRWFRAAVSHRNTWWCLKQVQKVNATNVSSICRGLFQALISFQGPTSSASLQRVHHRLGLFELCVETKANHQQISIIYWRKKNILRIRNKIDKLTCQQNPEFLSRNRDYSGLCGACCYSLSLQLQLDQRLIYLLQLTGA